MIVMKYQNNDKKERLDHFLTQELSLTRSKVTNMINNNLVLVNNRIVKAGYILLENDEITVVEKETSKNDDQIKAIDYELDIVYEDQYLMIVNKPNHLLVHPTSFNETNTLANYVKAYFQKQGIQFKNDDLRWGICHRLDKDTTGLLIVAKNYDIQEKIQEEIKNKLVKREYIGLVKGTFESKKMKIDVPLKRGTKGKLYMEISTSFDARPAITYIDVLEEYGSFSKVKFRLETGRTHQIRVHCRYLNHPIINDPMYSNEAPFSKFNQYLHAFRLAFNHPITNEYIEIESSLPIEFEEYIKKNKES